MIVVKVEVWPFGMQERAHELARVKIANVGGTSHFGDYEVDAVIPGASLARDGEVHRYARTRPILDLVTLALRAVGFGE